MHKHQPPVVKLVTFELLSSTSTGDVELTNWLCSLWYSELRHLVWPLRNIVAEQKNSTKDACGHTLGRKKHLLSYPVNSLEAENTTY